MKNYVPQFALDPATGRMMPFTPGRKRDTVQGEYLDDEIYAIHKQRAELYEKYKDDPMNEAVVNYWAELGMKKELYDNEPDGAHAWSIFTPLSMKEGKKYALIYMSHGGGNAINLAETYGFNQLAAVERFIVCYPNNGDGSNAEVDTEFPRVLGRIRELGYPIDWERVYCVGFSSGSEASACAACTCPRLCAAVGVLPGGQPFKDLEFYTGADYYATTEGLRIPGCFVGGSMDPASYPAPYLLYNEPKPHRAVNLDIWMREIAQVKNDKSVTPESIYANLQSENPVRREFGLEFDREYSFRAEDMDWVGGDFYGKDGAPVMRFARAIGARHIVWDSQINIVWDYIKHFRRDQQTGESLYDPVACWGER